MKLKDIILIKLSAVVVLLTLNTTVIGQCEIYASATPSTIYCGQEAILSVSAYGSGTVMLNESFDSGSFGPGWSSTPNAVMWNNPCSPSGVDGTTHAWMGNSTSVPRDIVTTAYDITAATAGVTVCFDLLFATQAQAAPCEGPDEPDEGVYFQYSIDGGNTWVTINYFDPQGGYNTPYTSWDKWCFEIPAAAITANTMFRWHQSADSGADYDHWGIDNVEIVQNDVDAYIEWGTPGDSYYHNYGVGNSGGENPNHVSPTTTTTYDVKITTGDGSVCTDQVTVTVIDPVYEVDIDVNPNPVCPGDCADISGTAVQVLDPGGTVTFDQNELNPVGGFGFGSIGAEVNINVQGINTNNIYTGLIQEVCIHNFTYFAGGFPNSVGIHNFEFTLICPDGTEMTLIPQGTLQASSNGDNLDGVCFIPVGGATNIGSQSPPYSGTYDPADPFSVLNGCDPNGVWTIEATASTLIGVGVGNFSGWSITFDNPPIHNDINYSWSPTTDLSGPTSGTNTQAINNQACPPSTTSYELTVDNGVAGCLTHTETVDIVVNPNCSCTPPNIVTIPLVGCNVDLSDAIDPSSDAANLSYHGSQGDALADINPITGNVNTTGSYWVRAVDPSDPTCYWAYEITVTVPIITYQTTNTNPACGQSDGEINLTASDGTSPYTYSIDGGATSQGSGNFTNLGAGTYNIFIVDALGCEVTGTENLSNVGGVTIDDVQTQDPSCSNDDGTISITVSGGTSYDFQWEDALGNTLGSITNTIGNLPAGTYTVVVTDDAGCTATEVITLNPPSGADDASFDFADFCEGAPNGPTNIATPGGTFSFNPLPTDNATIDPLTGEIFSGVPGTTYFVEYTTFGNCPSTSTESVTVFFVPIADFHVEPNEGVPPLEVEIDNNSSSNIVSSLWNFGDGNIEVNNNEFLSYTYTDAGQYTLVLTVESEDGCTNFISKEINVFHSDIEWKFPNVFTPNGDGQNDFFKLVGHLNVHEFEIIVLNRWGNTVFESNSVEFNWNGKVNNSGADCIDGTYFYKARLMNYNGDEEEVHGFVHLARNK